MKYLLVVLIGLAIVGCKAEDTIPKGAVELLTNNSTKSWKLSDGVIQLDPTSQISIFGLRPACETDNVLTLRSDRTYDLTEGATKCAATDSDDIVRNAKWNVTEDGKVLTVDRFIFFNYTVNNAVFKLTAIDETSFSGETEVEFQGQKYTGVVKFDAVN